MIPSTFHAPSFHVRPPMPSQRFLEELNGILRRAGIRSSFDVTRPAAGPSESGALDADSVVGRVQTFVDAHLDADLTVDDLADAVDLSSSSLERRFRAEMDTTPWRHVLARRIDAAKRLLETTDRSLVAIAFDTGFYDQSHFTRTFKRLEGQPPGAYRDDAKDE